MHLTTAITLCLVALAMPNRANAQASDSADDYGLNAIDVSTHARGIVPLPESVDRTLRRHFARYTRVVAPNGKPIHILAQAAWSEDQIMHARKVLEHLLTDVPGTRFGADKSSVANAMAERRATLVLFEDERMMEKAFRGRLGELHLGMQDLRANECPAVGSEDYLAHKTRDASYEEILHLVHDYGIRPALKEYDGLIQQASDRATEMGRWQPWPEDEPDSFRNEYIAAAYDNYLDLWTVPPTHYEGQKLEAEDLPKGTSHFGSFGAGSRAALKVDDKKGYQLMLDFFPQALTYTAELPVDFTGMFCIDLQKDLRYTTKAQHLRNVTLRGSKDAGLKGNASANNLTGNNGANILHGGGGDDFLRGGAGEDTAVFQGPASEYTIDALKDGVRVTDTTPGRDGVDWLWEIEQFQFRDGRQESPQ